MTVGHVMSRLLKSLNERYDRAVMWRLTLSSCPQCEYLVLSETELSITLILKSEAPFSVIYSWVLVFQHEEFLEGGSRRPVFILMFGVKRNVMADRAYTRMCSHSLSMPLTEKRDS